MHMADALVSPAVGGTMMAAGAGLILWCGRKLNRSGDDHLVPLMGVLGAFVFAVQMINFSIPLTGSSGHLGGGILLAILLGPHAAFIVIASVLMVQALFFADGGLLALGCNVVNLGFFPVFVAYPLICRPIVGQARGGGRLWLGAVLGAVAGLQMGSLAVVIETTMSGVSELPFKSFVALMQPVHLVIGLVEGVATAAVAAFVLKARPTAMAGVSGVSSRWGVASFLAVAVLTAGVLSWFASTRPDGLEWAMNKITEGKEHEAPGSSVHGQIAAVQESVTLLPGYEFRAAEGGAAVGGAEASNESSRWPAVSAGRSVAGLVGGGLVLLISGSIGYGLRRFGALRAGRERAHGFWKIR
ncbi:MAG: energy-coupling factor ABC transporter permease [bacterium]